VTTTEMLLMAEAVSRTRAVWTWPDISATLG
jgi:hypothetical protein